jgi:hypothetical protein
MFGAWKKPLFCCLDFSVVVAQVFGVKHHPRIMTYHDGSPVKLGDIVTISLRDCRAKARVVMLGDTREHLDIDKQFLEWVERDKALLEPSYVVVDHNPLAHNDPQYAPVGNYMFTQLDECVTHEG